MVTGGPVKAEGQGNVGGDFSELSSARNSRASALGGRRSELLAEISNRAIQPGGSRTPSGEQWGSGTFASPGPNRWSWLAQSRLKEAKAAPGGATAVNPNRSYNLPETLAASNLELVRALKEQSVKEQSVKEQWNRRSESGGMGRLLRNGLNYSPTAIVGRGAARLGQGVWAAGGAANELVQEALPSDYQQSLQQALKSPFVMHPSTAGKLGLGLTGVVALYRGASRLAEGLEAFREAAGDLAATVRQGAVRGLRAAGRGLKAAGLAVVNKAANPQFWIDTGRGLWEIGAQVVKGTLSLGAALLKPSNWLKALNFVGTVAVAGVELVGRGLKGAVSIVTNKDNWRALGRALKSAASGVATFAVNVVTNPAEAWRSIKQVGAQIWQGVKAVGAFAKSVSDSIGLTDVAVGLYQLGRLPMVLLHGSLRSGAGLLRDLALVTAGKIPPEQLKENLIARVKQVAGDYRQCVNESGRLLTGLKQLTGFNDLKACAQSIRQGDWSAAAGHLFNAAMQVATVAFVVSTAGAGVGVILGVGVGRQAARAAAQQALNKAGARVFAKGTREAGQKVLQAVVSKIDRTALAKLGQTAADQSALKLGGRVAKLGPRQLNGVALEQAYLKGGTKLTGKLLDKVGYEKIVFKAAKDFLREGMKKGTLQAELRSLGFGKWRAGRMAQRLARGGADDVVAKILVRRISQPVTAYLQQGVKASFNRRLRAILGNRVAKLNASSELKEAARVLNGALRSNAKRLAGRQAAQKSVGGVRGLGRANAPSKAEIKSAYDRLLSAYVKRAEKGLNKGISRCVTAKTTRAVRRAFSSFRKAHKPLPPSRAKEGAVVLGTHAAQEPKSERQDPKKGVAQTRAAGAELDHSVAQKSKIVSAGGVTTQTVYVREGDKWREVASKVLVDNREAIRRENRPKPAF